MLSVYPTIGPQSGGTHLAITGQYLNIGSKITAYLDDLVCAVNLTQASNSRLTCITSRAPKPMNIENLTLSIDGANRTLRNNPFNYTQDPTIMEIKPLKSFISGGRMITVHGTNLDSIQAPEMEVYLPNGRTPINKTSCIVLNSNQMECPSPAVNRQFHEAVKLNSRVSRSVRKYSNLKQIPETQLVLRIGFVMDNVESVQDLDKHFLNLRSQLIFVDDPKFCKFPNEVKLYKGDTLVIEGENLNIASDESDVIVTIGPKYCNVTSLAMTQLVCTPPETQPQETDENGVKVNQLILNEKLWVILVCL